MKQYYLENYLEIKVYQILSVKHDTTFKFQKASLGEKKQPWTTQQVTLTFHGICFRVMTRVRQEECPGAQWRR